MKVYTDGEEIKSKEVNFIEMSEIRNFLRIMSNKRSYFGFQSSYNARDFNININLRAFCVLFVNGSALA